MWKLIHVVAAVRLLVHRRIRFATFRMTQREWLVAVAARHGSCVLGPEFPVWAGGADHG